MAVQQQQHRLRHTKFIQILQISRNRKVLPPLPHTHISIHIFKLCAMQFAFNACARRHDNGLAMLTNQIEGFVQMTRGPAPPNRSRPSDFSFAFSEAGDDVMPNSLHVLVCTCALSACGLRRLRF